jgi:hypothetical protein
MTLHFHSRPWQVHERDDGLEIQFGDGNVDAATLATLANELFDLVRASGCRTLYLDCAGLSLPVRVLADTLGELHERLRASETRLVLVHAAPSLAELLPADS